MIRQAQKKRLLEVQIVNLRDFARDRHRTVDDRPFGGGEGMVLKAEPLFEAVEWCRARTEGPSDVILLSPQGTRFDQEKARELARRSHLVLICGRYEGVDQRVADRLVDQELSIGDFVLSGGECAALTIVDAVVRLIPGVVGKPGSVEKESFTEDLLDYPQYTRPADFRGLKVPEVLLSGDHQAVHRWRREQALRRTLERRPDLLGRARPVQANTGDSGEEDKRVLSRASSGGCE